MTRTAGLESAKEGTLTGRGSPLLGRRSERRVLDALLDAGRAGRSGALVVRGEPGIGKTALLDYAIEAASDFTVVRAAGVESEMELAFAAVQQLCVPLLPLLDRLPAPQGVALGEAFGLQTGPPPDRFLIGLGLLTLLSEAADERPLLCVIDDGQWLDRASAQALAFVAKRLREDSVVMLIATREPNAYFPELDGLAVGGLANGDARELLGEAVRGPLDERVRDRIVAESRGNPLALLELSPSLSPSELAGGFGLPTAEPVSAQIEDSFERRLRRLPEATQLLLLVAAAEPLGDPALLWDAAAQLGIAAEALEPAETDRLLEVGAQVRFRHPLVRSVVYRAASVADRRKVHGALAGATSPVLDPDRRAWHRAQATAGTDDDVADELERSADRARARGGVAAAAAFLERSVALTHDPARRAQRALNAAQAHHLAGAADAALRLLETAASGPLTELASARVDLLRAQIAFASRRGSDAPQLLVRAAERFESVDVNLARETYLEAMSAAQFAAASGRRSSLAEASAAVRAAHPVRRPARATDLLLEGLAVRFTDGYTASVPTLRRALDAFRSDELSPDEVLRWIWLACRSAVDLWDSESWDVLCERQVDLARATGALSVLPLALSQRVSTSIFKGRMAEAATLIEEIEATSDAIGIELPPYAALLFAAWKGREAETRRLIDTTIDDVTQRGETLAITAAHWAGAVLYNGLGRYEEALSAAVRGSEYPEDLGFSTWSLVEMIEAAVRSGNRDHASEAFERLAEMTRASATDWGLGVEARSEALLHEGSTAERLYGEAIERLGRAGARLELARAHLVYGEWLRRERRRIDARAHLRIASDMFSGLGVDAFAQRAARELGATGEHARKRVVGTFDDLTAQEMHIAVLARDGLSNDEIAARLFISPRTVEYHLGKIFTKLDIKSRHQLAAALDQASTDN